ncbi:FAD-dependent oxidoreductase [Flavobacterium sp. MFBS3-15]|uniref:flavin monoamine oxidase family protein n=1 Tax=Flavobacterium sp. MFBS3-15 TaxID=2989816 RepID=UPI0022360263|nr:NAD(P)/FAD-dependent oxidoreductase [Flavobacterium sp. MFBS3-15]MCW4469399.1 FAD-dependent oxidoreductase [Flavobacterium sp. MFBS3-15]
MKSEILIIGAGASGLMAAYTLAKAGKTVTVLEARNRIGGRIHTMTGKGFSMPVELGAEFVHGNLPVTLGLLKQAGIAYKDVGFEMWQYHGGMLEQSDEFVEGWDAFLEKLNQLEEDMPILDFIEKEFSGEEYVVMRRQIVDYVSGYDTADVNDAGAFALRNEWNHEDEDAQHRINEGYGALMDYLARGVRNPGNQIHLNTVVSEIAWEKNAVKAIAADGSIYSADKIIIALPLGVLQFTQGKGAVQFSPSIERQEKAFRDIGFGSVIKILLEFDAVFWEGAAGSMGFLFSDEKIPTYWTQSPLRSPLLTGWLGGPPAYAQKDASAGAVLQMALGSLANIFGRTREELHGRLVAWQVANWTAEPFTRGSYAYDKVESPAARKILLQPVEGTLYFAGEYLYDGPAMGTVEAALTSGRDSAMKLLAGSSK